eukprot:scaffold7841_cov484-Prasinococcus_capsulatus_cf.AAC.1
MTTIFVLPPPFESRVLGVSRMRRHAPRTCCPDCRQAVLQHAKQDDPKSVIKAIDDYCWRNPTMNIGDVKGTAHVRGSWLVLASGGGVGQQAQGCALAETRSHP